jgi:hypothetical protein
LTLSFQHIFRTLRKPISKEPGPWISRWTGVVASYYFLTGKRPIYIHNLHQKYGNYLTYSLSI